MQLSCGIKSILTYLTPTDLAWFRTWNAYSFAHSVPVTDKCPPPTAGIVNLNLEYRETD